MTAALNSAVGGLRGATIRPGLQTVEGRAAGPDSPAVAVNADVSSLMFLHACEKPARNSAAYTAIWNFADTAELVGWYEVVFQDGMSASVPLRYGVNILEPKPPSGKNVAYYSEAVDCGEATLYAYEWINPRFGQPVREVRLRQAKKDNPVWLAAMGAVHRRVPPDPKPLQLVGEPFRVQK
jgi:hypothetical protein